MSRKKKDYSVGYGRPPAHTRFQKGQSGNPSGKPRKVPSDEDLLLRELASRVNVGEGGKMKRMSKLEVMIKKQVLLAMQGDPKAVRLVTDVYRTALKNQTPAEQEEIMQVTLVFEEEERRRRDILGDDRPDWKDDLDEF